MKRTKNTLKSYFQTGDVPEQWQYENLIDSFWHLDDEIPATNLNTLAAIKNQENTFTEDQIFNADTYLNGYNEINNAVFLGDVGFDGDAVFTGRLTAQQDILSNGPISSNAGISINQLDQNTRLQFSRSGHTDYG